MLVTLWSGLVLGAIYATVAFGFSLSMLPSGVFNFAQGAVVVAGTYLTYTFLARTHVGVWTVVVLNAIIGMMLGVLCEVVCVRPLRRRGHGLARHTELLTTIGMSTVLVGGIGLIWGYLPTAVPFTGSTAPVRVLGVAARPDQIITVLGAIGAAVGLQLGFRHTRWGQACLAVAEDREAAALRGIDVNAFSLAGFAAAGAFGTVSAIAIGPITYALPGLAYTLALGGFVALAIGGHGNFVGCLAGGLLTGVVASLATRYLGAVYDELLVLALLLLTLSVRPNGLGLPVAVRRV